MLKSTFNLEKSMCICQGNFFVYHVTGSTYSKIIFWVLYVSRIYQNFLGKGLEKTNQIVSELICSICKVLNFTGVFTTKQWNYQCLITTPFVGKLQNQPPEVFYKKRCS